jgi:hypothetical protein
MTEPCASIDSRRLRMSPTAAINIHAFARPSTFAAFCRRPASATFNCGARLTLRQAGKILHDSTDRSGILHLETLRGTSIVGLRRGGE